MHADTRRVAYRLGPSAFLGMADDLRIMDSPFATVSGNGTTAPPRGDQHRRRQAHAFYGAGAAELPSSQSKVAIFATATGHLHVSVSPSGYLHSHATASGDFQGFASSASSTSSAGNLSRPAISRRHPQDDAPPQMAQFPPGHDAVASDTRHDDNLADHASFGAGVSTASADSSAIYPA